MFDDNIFDTARGFAAQGDARAFQQCAVANNNIARGSGQLLRFCATPRFHADIVVITGDRTALNAN